MVTREEFVKNVKSMIEESFGKFKSINPVIFAFNLDLSRMEIYMIDKMEDDNDKNNVADFIKGIRKTHPYLAFVTEAWISDNLKTRPSLDPNKIEGVVITYYLENDVSISTAEILRNNNFVTLGPWNYQDLQSKVSGRFI